LEPQQADVTGLLEAWRSGDGRALDALAPVVYDELRRLAARYLRRERPGHTLQGTEIVHEAYMRLVQQRVPWQNRAHFYAIAAQCIRRILVDHARNRHAAKRGAGNLMLALDEALATPERRDVDLARLDDALTDLAKLDEQQARIVELRYFTGLSIEETAEALGISPATVKRDWTTAKAWLYRALCGDGG
jgi:RNA polymerase sigma factor (TIGR02999 family)